MEDRAQDDVIEEGTASPRRSFATGPRRMTKRDLLRLRAALVEHGITVREFAESCGLAVGNLYALFRGKSGLGLERELALMEGIARYHLDEEPEFHDDDWRPRSIYYEAQVARRRQKIGPTETKAQ